MTAKLRVKAFKPARGALAVWRARSAFVVIGHFANDKAELFTRRHLTTSNLFKPTNLLLLSTPRTYCHLLPIISPSS